MHCIFGNFPQQSASKWTIMSYKCFINSIYINHFVFLSIMNKKLSYEVNISQCIVSKQVPVAQVLSKDAEEYCYLFVFFCNKIPNSA